jgi:hypothetical protein
LTGWLGLIVDTEPCCCGHPGDLDEPGLRCYQEVVETQVGPETDCMGRG